MEPSLLENFLQSKRTPWVVAGLTILLFTIANLPWQLDDYDQAKQAFTSFEMIEDGHWFYQRTPREHVATKPPLVGWISAGVFSLTCSWDLAWRLPSLLAAIAISVLLFRTANLAYGAIAGLIAIGAFGLNLLSPRLATLVRTDMPLAFVIFLIGILVWRKIQKEEAWKPRDRIYIFALLTGAMLIKGPIVYAFLLPGIALFEWRCRQHALVAGVHRRVVDRPVSASTQRGGYRARGLAGGHGLLLWASSSCGSWAELFFSLAFSIKLWCVNLQGVSEKQYIGRDRFIFICRICSTDLRPGAC